MSNIASRGWPAAALLGGMLGCAPENIGDCTPLIAYPIGDNLSSVDVADLDGDGAPDILLGCSRSTRIMRNLGDGTFTGDRIVDLNPDEPVNNAVADFDGDGDADIAVVEFYDNEGTLLLHHEGGTFFPVDEFPVDASPNANPSWATAADVNGDGKFDLAVGVTLDFEGPSSVNVLLNEGDGPFGVSFADPAATPAGSGKLSLIAADLDGDGRPDFALTDDSELRVLLQQAGGTFVEGGTYAAGAGPAGLAAADLNGDGKLDLAVTQFLSDDGLRVFLQEGSGMFAPPQVYTTGNGAVSVAAADLNGDGKLDLAVARISDADDLVLLHGQGDGLFGDPIFVTLESDETLAVAAADLNGDGAADLVTGSYDRYVSVLLSCAD